MKKEMAVSMELDAEPYGTEKIREKICLVMPYTGLLLNSGSKKIRGLFSDEHFPIKLSSSMVCRFCRKKHTVGPPGDNENQM